MASLTQFVFKLEKVFVNVCQGKGLDHCISQ